LKHALLIDRFFFGGIDFISFHPYGLFLTLSKHFINNNIGFFMKSKGEITVQTPPEARVK